MSKAALQCPGILHRTAAFLWLLAPLTLLLAQAAPYERTFPQSPAHVKEILAKLQSTAGRLPVLDGFVVPAGQPLERYQRGYYQCSLQVSPAPGGGSRVQINAKITAWYADPDPAKSGYRVLASNGRIEGDLLDRLEDALGGPAAKSDAAPAKPASTAKPKASTNASPPLISAPMPRDTVPGEPIGSTKKTASPSPFELGTTAGEGAASLETGKAGTDKHAEELTQEARNLEEILRNQSHPTNLAAVKQAETPVLTSPNEGAKVLFLASAEDEFEILDINPEWVHVRISGLSRGWIRRSNLEMAASPVTQVEVPDKPVEDNPSAKDVPGDGPPFQVENEQIASFPGDWELLRGKMVKIVTVQKTRSTGTGSQAKMDFAKSIFTREYAALTQASSSAAGVVVIFDSEDGGMLAATLPVLQSWRAGTLSDQAFWHRCYFDPPEMFENSGQ